jgi:hypothetical protein
MRAKAILLIVGVLSILAWSAPASAIPAFARKYGTSCTTCHTIYPKLTPFGEAFRRNGFKFPGKDEDFIKQEMIPLGQEAYRKVFPKAVWPGILPASVPIALGVNGFAMFHPDVHSAAARADNGSWWHLQNLVDEAHIWAGGSFSEHISYFAELTFGIDGSIDLEHAELHFNDLVPKAKHVLNVYVGRGFPNLTMWGPHSSYVVDTVMPALMVTQLFGATSDSFTPMGQYNLIEVNGTVKGRFIYGIGVNSGANVDVRTTQDAYAHLGFKLGGMRLDGEGDTGGDPQKPWAENAIGLDAWGYYSASRYTPQATPLQPVDQTIPNLQDRTWVAGTHLRGTLGSFELDAGFSYEWHNHATAFNTAVKAFTQYDELSYVIYPWLVVAARLEYGSVAQANGPRMNDVKIMPAIDALIRPNLKVQLVAQLEWANGVPDPNFLDPTGAPLTSWGAFGGFVDLPKGSVFELETLALNVAYAF